MSRKITILFGIALEIKCLKLIKYKTKYVYIKRLRILSRVHVLLLCVVLDVKSLLWLKKKCIHCVLLFDQQHTTNFEIHEILMFGKIAALVLPYILRY